MGGQSDDHGRFSGDPTAIWLTDADAPDRNMQLTVDFSFVDPDQHTWDAPAQSVVDGASIPRPLWSLVGSPYTGDYRRASIVHDIACDRAGNDATKRAAADRMFYHACRAGGCSVVDATILYIGVRIGAAFPSVAAWQAATDDGRPHTETSPAEQRVQADFALAARQVISRGKTDDIFEIERRTDDALSQITGVSLRSR